MMVVSVILTHADESLEGQMRFHPGVVGGVSGLNGKSNGKPMGQQDGRWERVSTCATKREAT
jgi:hypothetical protein